MTPRPSRQLGRSAEARRRPSLGPRAEANLALLRNMAYGGPAPARRRRKQNSPGSRPDRCAGGVEGWLSEGQAAGSRRPFLRCPAAAVGEDGLVQGRSTVVIAQAVSDGVEVVAIDPHAGGDRGPRRSRRSAAAVRLTTTPSAPTLSAWGWRAGCGTCASPRVRLTERSRSDRRPLCRRRSRYAPARADLKNWGAHVRMGGTMLVHDACDAVGVALAQLRLLFLSRKWSTRAGPLTRRVPARAPPRASDGHQRAAANRRAAVLRPQRPDQAGDARGSAASGPGTRSARRRRLALLRSRSAPTAQARSGSDRRERGSAHSVRGEAGDSTSATGPRQHQGPAAVPSCRPPTAATGTSSHSDRARPVAGAA